MWDMYQYVAWRQIYSNTNGKKIDFFMGIRLQFFSIWSSLYHKHLGFALHIFVFECRQNSISCLIAIYVSKRFFTPLPFHLASIAKQKNWKTNDIPKFHRVAFRFRRGNQTLKFFYLLLYTNLSHDGNLEGAICFKYLYALNDNHFYQNKECFNSHNKIWN